jgi:hypothetical protein
VQHDLAFLEAEVDPRNHVHGLRAKFQVGLKISVVAVNVREGGQTQLDLIAAIRLQQLKFALR